MEILLTIFYSLLFIFLIYKLPFFKIEGFSWKSLTFVFLLKIAAGLLMYFIYTYYYKDRATADIFKYFDDSKVMYNALWQHPLDFFKMLFGIGNDSPYFDTYYKEMNNWYRVFESNIYNDSHTIIRFNAAMRLFSFGYFNVHTVFMCFISFTGLVALYRFFVRYFVNIKKLLFFSVFLLPSVLFWGSGVLKEAILLFGMGMLLYNIDILTRKNFRFRNLIWLLMSMILLIYTKYYIFIILFPLLISFLWCRYTSEKHSLLKYATVLLIYIIAGLNIHLLFPDYNILSIIAFKQNDFIGLAKQMHSGSLLTQNLLQPNLFSILKAVPYSFYNTFFRPYIFEANSFLILFSAVENLMILLILIVCIVFSSRRVSNKPVFFLCLFFFIGTFTLTGLTTPVLGAMVRYKVPAMPFMLMVFFMMLDKDKLQRRLPFLKKFLF